MTALVFLVLPDESPLASLWMKCACAKVTVYQMSALTIEVGGLTSPPIIHMEFVLCDLQGRAVVGSCCGRLESRQQLCYGSIDKQMASGN